MIHAGQRLSLKLSCLGLFTLVAVAFPGHLEIRGQPHI